MRIAFDFHGVLQAYPEKFKKILADLTTNHRIYIISGPPLEEIEEQLELTGYEQGYHYDYIISVVDWLKDQGVEMKLNQQGSYYCKQRYWWESKGLICEAEEIDMLFDDSILYKEYMKEDCPTLFLHIQ